MHFYSKQNRYAIFLYILVLVIVTACANPIMDANHMQTNMSSSGTLQINLTPLESDRSVIPDNYLEAIDRYEILLTGTQAMGPLTVTDSTILLEDLPLGAYTISVTALNSESLTLAVGSAADIDVVADIAGTADIELLPVMGGEGTIAVEYDWSSAGLTEGRIDKVIATLTPTGGTPTSIDMEITGNGLEFSGSFPSGEYFLSCELFDDGTLISSVAETIQIFDDLETETKLSFGSEAFNTVPETPGAPETTQSGLSVNLTWIDTSDLETGYSVYRSENGGEFNLIGSGLPANTVSWTDSPIVPGTEYTYQIVALNAFGESEPQEVSITVAPLVTAPAVTVNPLPPIASIVLGDSENLISTALLIDGFENTFNRSGLEILSVSVSGGASAYLENGHVVMDVSSIPFESEGEEIILEYVVHIIGEPINDTFTANGVVSLSLTAPEVEVINEEDLLGPVQGFVYDDRRDLERKMQLYEPADPQEIFDNWGRLSNHMYFRDGDDAEESSESKNDEAGLALLWKLKNDSDGSYIEYAKNSVYAGLVSPDGEESENFSLEATVSSKDDDDDTVGLIVAFFREGNSNYILEAARSQGSTSGGDFVEPRQGWGLIVRRLSEGDDRPEIGKVLWSRQLNIGGLKSDGWKNARTRIKVVRSGNSVTVSTTDWDDEGNYVPGSVISVELNSDRQLARFTGPRKFGYFTASQERSSFRDITLEGGVIQDKMFYLDPETGVSEVWWYDIVSNQWILMSGTDIQGVIGYPLEITNPETGETYLIERRGYSRGRWQDRWNRWSQWDRFDRNRPDRNRSDGKNDD